MGCHLLGWRGHPKLRLVVVWRGVQCGDEFHYNGGIDKLTRAFFNQAIDHEGGCHGRRDMPFQWMRFFYFPERIMEEESDIIMCFVRFA